MNRVGLLLGTLLAITLLFAPGCTDDENLSEISAAELYIDPPNLHFPFTSLGDKSEQSTLLQNSGQASLRLRDFEFVSSDGKSAAAFSLVTPSAQSSVTLEAGESLEIIVQYHPTTIDDYQAALRVSTNLPNRSTVDIGLITPRLAPEIYSPQGIDFRAVPTGESRWQMSHIQNIGSTPLHIADVSVEGEAFRVSFPPGADVNVPTEGDSDDPPAVLLPGETALMRVWFEPFYERVAVSALDISSDDPRSPIYKVFLFGNASGAVCIDEDGEGFSDQCTDPPAPECSGTSLINWRSDGRCIDGFCRHEARTTPCLGQTPRCLNDNEILLVTGDCQGGQCTTIEEIESCDAPPRSLCVDLYAPQDLSPEELELLWDLMERLDWDSDVFNDEYGVIEGAFLGWSEAGQCLDGTCHYEPELTPCRQGCNQDRSICNCPLSCDQPPAPRCLDEDTLLSFSDEGSCSPDEGECTYTATEIHCALGCDLDTDQCRCPTCDEPPAAQCSGDELQQWVGPGSCELGLCEYPSEIIPCDRPPASQCTGSHELEVWESLGRCADDACAYESTSIFCERGCDSDRGRCVPPSMTGEASTWGREFWFAFMENIPTAFNGPPRLTFMIGSAVDTQGYARIVATGLTIPFTISAGEYAELDLGQSYYYPTGGDTIDKKGIQVVADDPVTVTSVHKRIFQSDASNILPLQELGSEYFALAVEPQSGSFPSQIIVLAVEDGTTVEITPVVTTMGLRPGGLPFTIELDAGDVYQMQAQSDLSGTHVRSLNDRPIALFGGAVAAEVECGPNNHIYHQNLPVKRWGHEYVVIPYYGQNGDWIKVVARADDTELRLDCGSAVAMNRGDVWNGEVTDTTRITANAPIAVAQYNRGQACNGYGIGDPSLTVLVPTALHTTYALFRHTKFLVGTDGVTMGDGEYFVNLLGSPSATTLLNGVNVSTDFQAGPAQRTWTQMPLRSGVGVYEFVSTQPFSGVAYAYSDMDNYSYHLGYNCDGCLDELDTVPICLP